MTFLSSEEFSKRPDSRDIDKVIVARAQASVTVTLPLLYMGSFYPSSINVQKLFDIGLR